MSNGKQPAFPCHRSDHTPSGMTFRQYLVSQLAPVMLKSFFNHDAWSDYDDAARSLMNFVDAIIEAEQKEI